MKSSAEPSTMRCNTGWIHSVESFGTVDGPGIRYVVFFQGCPMRCLYCHNPDTWAMNTGNQMTVEEILADYKKNEGFYRGGGITATGGEPLVQLEFLITLFEEAKKAGIHTCLDTSGIAYRKELKDDFEALCKVTDLVLLDIKHSNEEKHQYLTGQSSKPVWEFLHFLKEQNVRVRIRHVLVPGLTLVQEDLYELGRALRGFTNIKELELLPYHRMGINKYQQMNIPYLLAEEKEPTKEEAEKARAWFMEGLKS